MQAVFKTGLSSSEEESIKAYCNSADYCSIEQSIGWNELFYRSKIRYFYLTDESGIKSFCQIIENFRFAQIHFGPVCCDKELMVTSIREIINYYKKHRFCYLGIQMYYKSGYDTDYIEYTLSKDYNIKYLFDSKNTKSSIEINLQDSFDEIYKRIRKGHKSDIKKAIKMGVTADVVKDITELHSFAEVYARMCKARKIDDGGFSGKQIEEVHKYLTDNHKGQIIVVKDNSGIVIGGIILVYQGISVRFFRGTSDPERRDIPVLHLALYESIKKAKEANFKYFDFWGYNHFVNENDQVFQINHFKKGFGGDFTFFAKNMNIDLFPFGAGIYSLYLWIRKIKNMIF
jgi:lipid II:glycine glycyltransferase (peptidoglycan interpeptide bridge formation enzyme)